MKTAVAQVLLSALALSLAPEARADCRSDRAADPIFAHPYGEPPAPCPVESAPIDSEHPDVLADDRGPRRLYTLGISGLEGGATIAVLGGVFYLASLFLNEGDRAERVFHWGGIGVAAVGGAIFLTGGVLLGVEWATRPAPTPDRRGAQLQLALRF